LIVPEVTMFGLANFSVLTIIAARKEQKRSTYGLLAIVLSVIMAGLYYTQKYTVNEALSVLIKAAVLIVAAIITRQTSGDLTIVQVL
jgi:hypothetical protein